MKGSENNFYPKEFVLKCFKEWESMSPKANLFSSIDDYIDFRWKQYLQDLEEKVSIKL